MTYLHKSGLEKHDTGEENRNFKTGFQGINPPRAQSPLDAFALKGRPEVEPDIWNLFVAF